jgi:two-component system, sensor histidine kinase and response regulator
MTKILMIEDEAILREEVLEWLTLENFDALGAADGIAGIEAAFHHLPDLIICDITMPRLDGHGVLLELRANPATIDIPFIFVTARAAYDDVRRGMDLGADDYITKPFTRLELLRAVQTRLEKKAVLEQKRQFEVQQWQQAWEQEREQRLLKSKLVAMFSHDFRNPLTSIMSSNALLRDYADRLDENRRLAHFNRVETSVRQLLQMLDDMLVVAQMETGHLEFKPEPLNLERFFQGIIDEFQAMHSETHAIVFKCASSGDLPADSRLLHQIVANLISNAIKYSPPGSEVSVSLDHFDGYIELSVQDQGIGIPEADQHRLFASFQRASNVGSVAGTGLGLAIVQQSAELHGGSVHLASQVNVGTTVTVKIPI